MVTVTKRSTLTGKFNSMTFDMFNEEFEACHEKWEDGELIQKAFPMLTTDEREFLISGITPAEWTNTFGKDEI